MDLNPEQAKKVLVLLDGLALLEEVYSAVNEIQPRVAKAMMEASLLGRHGGVAEPLTEGAGEEATFDALADHLYRAAMGQLAVVHGWMVPARAVLDLGITLETAFEARHGGQSIVDMADAVLPEEEQEDHDCANCAKAEKCALRPILDGAAKARAN